VARGLSRRLGIRHIELDAIFWQANWTKLEQGEFEARVEEATRSGGWVVDGNYSERIRAIAWGAADTVIWLDLPRAVVIWQLVLRTARRIVSGGELWNGNRERSLRDQLSRDPAKSILLWSWRTYGPTKAEYELAMQRPEFARLRFVRLSSRRQIKRYLRTALRAGR
jgi:adenylate kinase family enzyme